MVVAPYSKIPNRGQGVSGVREGSRETMVKREYTTRKARENRKRTSGQPVFRIQRKRIGCTWSCPVNSDHPIKTKEEILDFAVNKFGPVEYTISCEFHKNGQNHYHADFKFERTVETEDVHAFDIKGVHCNINKPGGGWQDYIIKDGDFITNRKKDPYVRAMSSSTLTEALDILWESKPSDMCRFGQQIENNLSRRLIPSIPPAIYFGPYPDLDLSSWDYRTHSLLLYGAVGIQKTQLARYLMSHKFGDYEYIKGHHEMLKKLSFKLPFIFDEVYMIDRPQKCSRELTDVENGGCVECRNTPVHIPPMVPRIFLSNYEFPFRNPEESVYGRRVLTIFIPSPED